MNVLLYMQCKGATKISLDVLKKMNMLLKKKDTKQAKEGPKHFSKAGQFILIYLKALY